MSQTKVQLIKDGALAETVALSMMVIQITKIRFSGADTINSSKLKW